MWCNKCRWWTEHTMTGDVGIPIIKQIIERKERNSQFVVKHEYKCNKCRSITKKEYVEVCAYAHKKSIFYMPYDNKNLCVRDEEE